MTEKHLHEHDHAGHDHAHGVNRDADRRYLVLALAILLAFMVGEIIAGLLASSLALLSDAGHMLTDAGALGLALLTMRLAERPPGGRWTFGLKRSEILSAHVNGITLLLLAGSFGIEAIQRLLHPSAVAALVVFWVALAGIPVNLAAAWALSKANRQSLNVEGSFQHIVTDLYAFIATAVAGGLMWLTGFDWLDSIAALVVAYLMLRAGLSLVGASGRIFLEGAPVHLDPDAIGRRLAKDPAVAEVHDLHVWEVTSEFPALSAHVLVTGGLPCDGGCHEVRRRLERLLADEFHIDHTTLQMDHHQPVVRVPLDSVTRGPRPQAGSPAPA